MNKQGKKEGLIHDTVYVAMQDKTGNIWITGPSNGIEIIDPSKKNIRHLNVAGGLSDVNIQDIKQDIDGLVWLASRNSGVDVVDPVAGTVKNLNNQPDLKNTCLRILLPDKYGRMWMGTDKEVYLADTNKNTLTPIAINEGLVNNRILTLLEYNGSVRAGTSNKLSIITAPLPDGATSVNNTAGKERVIHLV